jgi:hypothetical protein
MFNTIIESYSLISLMLEVACVVYKLVFEST